MSVRNTGKEPALDFTWDIKAFLATDYDLAQKRSTIIGEYVDNCFSMQTKHRQQVIYPSTGFGSGFDFSDTIDGKLIDKDVVEGTLTIVVRGCIAYKTFNKTRHSAFCYFYKAKKTPDPAHLNLCAGGSDAD